MNIKPDHFTENNYYRRCKMMQVNRHQALRLLEIRQATRNMARNKYLSNSEFL